MIKTLEDRPVCSVLQVAGKPGHCARNRWQCDGARYGE